MLVLISSKQIAVKSPMCVVDVYCNNDFGVPEMDQTVADAAFPRAEQLLQVNKD